MGGSPRDTGVTTCPKRTFDQSGPSLAFLASILRMLTHDLRYTLFLLLGAQGRFRRVAGGSMSF